MTTKVYSQDGGEVGTVELNPDVFGIDPNKAVVHQYVVNYLANQRQGNSSSKGRSDVEGGGAKPWRQKGTGRARAGTSRSPLWRSGGITFGPKPRSYYSRFPRKMKRLAIKSVLSDRAQCDRITVLDKITLDAIKTQDFVSIMANLKLAGKKLLVLEHGQNDNVKKSVRNIPGVVYCEAGLLNAYDVLNSDQIVITKAGLSRVEEVFA